MNKAKRFLALAILAVMLLPTVAACSEKKSAQTTASSKNTVTETGATEEVPTLLPEGTWYNGYKFKFLIAGNFDNNDYEYEGNAAEPIDYAKYRRMTSIQEKYGVGITNEDVIAYNTSNGGGPGFDAVRRSYESGSYDYDAAMVGTYDVSQAAYLGFLTDLNSDELSYIDLTKSWWDQKANESLMIDGKMFYTTGDISITDNRITNCIMFNKTLVANTESMKNPYEMVEANEWTWYNFTTEVRKISEDLNGDDIRDQNDLYGLLTWKDAILAAYSSSGERYATVNDDEVELTIYTPKSVSMISKYIELVQDSNSVFNYQTLSGGWDAVRVQMFDNNQVAYYLTTLNTVPKHRDSETDFGILPIPKYDAEQADYGHLVAPFHCQFLCVPFFIEDAERTSGILEELAYDGKQYLTPAYYEETLVGQNVRDDESAEMLDIIFSSAIYDIGMYYRVGGLHNSLLNMAMTKKNTFASIYESARAVAESDVAKINDNFRNILGAE